MHLTVAVAYARVGRVGVMFLGLGIAVAQIYPGGIPPSYPGQYPYPGGRGPSGPGIPIPRRGSKQPKDTSKNQPLPNFRGTLKRMDNKSIVLALDDNRVLEFRRTDKTKFFKNGEELKSPQFATGDQLSVEGPEDAEGYLTAVNVYWEKAATNSEGQTESKKDEGVPDTWKDVSPAKPASESAAVTPPPAKPDPDDPGPPTLRRGKPADPARQHAAEPPAQPPPAPRAPVGPQQAAAEMPPPIARPAETAPPESPAIVRPGDDEELHVVYRAEDPLIRKAADVALDFTETLPSYVCQEVMSRYQSQSRPANWQALDIVTTNVVYENGKEDYRDVMVNGKPKKSIEETGGAWSTGEFGTVLIDLFSPATAADFHYRRDSRVAGINAKVYDFDVKRENSHWTIHVGAQTYDPAYKGSAWIDPKTARVLRIEMQALGFPDAFPTDHVESATDYEYIRLGDAKQYLLPVHAETLSCQRGTNVCSRNVIDFRNYHKYTGESTITFGTPK